MFRMNYQQVIDDILHRNPAAQFKWTVFIAAVQSNHCEHLVRPFPINFIDNNDEKDVVALASLTFSRFMINYFSEMPSTDLILSM